MTLTIFWRSKIAIDNISEDYTWVLPRWSTAWDVDGHIYIDLAQRSGGVHISTAWEIDGHIYTDLAQRSGGVHISTAWDIDGIFTLTMLRGQGTCTFRLHISHKWWQIEHHFCHQIGTNIALTFDLLIYIWPWPFLKDNDQGYAHVDCVTGVDRTNS